jgi:hypothetical protein
MSKPTKPKSTLKEEHRRNWLGPTGSLQEWRIMEQLANKPHSLAEQKLFVEWLHKPDEVANRNLMWWALVKKRYLGEFIHDTAMQRHAKLQPSIKWHITYLISAGYTQHEIAELLAVSKSTIEKNILAVKQEIRKEYDCAIEAVNLVQIGRWFLGL